MKDTIILAASIIFIFVTLFMPFLYCLFVMAYEAYNAKKKEKLNKKMIRRRL